jgi:hypothetical protein
MPRQEVVKFAFKGGYATDLLSTEGGSYLRQGSENFMVNGAGLLRPFKGLTLVPVILGSRKNFLTDDSYAGLGDETTAGSGSVFKTADLLMFIGQGPLRVRGLDIDVADTPDLGNISATTQLQYLTRNAGAFDNGSELFQVGHARPTKPILYIKSPPSAGQKTMNAAVTVVVWRVDSNTGQPSLPSPASDVLQVTNGSVIVQVEGADTNGQDVWGVGVTIPGLSDLGNLYELPIDIGGEQLEATLGYTRTVTGAAAAVLTASILDTTDEVTFDIPPDPAFTAADLGRRMSFSTYDSYILEIIDPQTIRMADANTSGGTISGTAPVVVHAVDGITRAFEISWADTDLFGQLLAPFDAFEPPDGFFAGVIMDTYYIEDTEGTIFYSIPNTFSFPRKKRKIFTEDKAVVYIDSGNGYHWRIANQSISQLYYSIGEKPIQLSVKSKVVGCKYPQNACLGYNGRLMVWAGRPNIIDDDGSMNSTFHTLVSQEFEGWENQTSDQPVIPAYDPIGQYELWCYGNKVMAFHAPSGAWCAPVDLSTWIDTDTIVGQVIVDGKLRLVVDTGTELVHYKWDDGAGSPVTAITYARENPSQQTTITLLAPTVRSGSSNVEMTVSVIKNYKDTLLAGTTTVDTSSDVQETISFAPNIRGCSKLAVKIEATGVGPGNYATGDFFVESVDVFGEWHEVPDRS